jgi:hypothetical protein
MRIKFKYLIYILQKKIFLCSIIAFQKENNFENDYNEKQQKDTENNKIQNLFHLKYNHYKYFLELLYKHKHIIDKRMHMRQSAIINRTIIVNDNTYRTVYFYISICKSDQIILRKNYFIETILFEKNEPMERKILFYSHFVKK